MSEQAFLEEVARRLKEAETGNPTLEAWIDWLKGAFYSHETQKASLLKTVAALRALALTSVGQRPLSVEEARLLNVCRICRGDPRAGSLLLNYGAEYAHQSCLFERG